MGFGHFKVERATFLGRRDGVDVTFVCLDDGGYGILRAAELVGTWKSDDLEASLRAFLHMIDRAPAMTPSPDVHATAAGL